MLSYSGDDSNWGAWTICADLGGTVVVAPRVVAPTLRLTAPTTGRRGDAVRASSSLAGGVLPTGTITFKVFRPGDDECAGTPLATSSFPVSANGTFTPGPFIPSRPGTYRWVGSYSVDLTHVPVTTVCGQRTSTTAVAQVTGDYDGGSHTDLGIYRPSNGGWYLNGIGGVGWGIGGDIPVPGDYDGDGDADIAVYRPSSGGWYRAGAPAEAWGGVPGDVPLPLPFAIRRSIPGFGGSAV